MIYNQFYPFEAMELPYDYAALEPEISEQTVFFHYNKNYLDALDKLNFIVSRDLLAQSTPLEALTKSKNLPLRRAAGSVFAHEMYFTSLAANPKEPSDYMKRRLEISFCSADGFHKAVKDAADTVYGSGFVWVGETPYGKLKAVSTPNHETPIFAEIKPIYALDLWEHSFYCDYINDRSAYVDAALRRADWDNMEKNLRDYSFVAR